MTEREHKIRSVLLAEAEKIASQMLYNIPAESHEAQIIRRRLESYKAMMQVAS